MENIEFSVLMCTYKNDDPILLEKAIESVYANSIKPDFFIPLKDQSGQIDMFDLSSINIISLVKLSILNFFVLIFTIDDSKYELGLYCNSFVELVDIFLS